MTEKKSWSRRPVGRGRPADPTDQTTFAGRVGARIRAAREEQGLTVEDAAARTGGAVTYGMWAMYERGRMKGGLGKYVAVAAALGVRLDDLLPPDLSGLLAAGAAPADIARIVS